MTNIFDVVHGVFYNLDVDLITKSISEVKLAIEESSKVSVQDQILLISGGEVLHDGDRLGYKGCGTVRKMAFSIQPCPVKEENPLFLFDLTNLDMSKKRSTQDRCAVGKIDMDELNDLKNMDYSMEWLENCYFFVERVNDDLKKLCQAGARNLSEQRMQVQGWMAASANLEDYCSSLTTCLDELNRVFSDYKNVDDTIVLDNRLSTRVEDLHGLSLPAHDEESKDLTTLYDWVNDNLEDFCGERGLPKFIEDVRKAVLKVDLLKIDCLVNEIETKLDILMDCSELSLDTRMAINVEDRFTDLQLAYDDLKSIAFNSSSYLMAINASLKKIKGDQKLKRDKRLLLDVCQVHRPTFDNIVDMRASALKRYDRIYNGKTELVKTLRSRMRWLVKVESELARLENKAILHTYQLSDLLRRVGFARQLASTPIVYPVVVDEINKRKQFSDVYSAVTAEKYQRPLFYIRLKKMRHKLIPTLGRVLNNERERRTSFTDQHGLHFLSSLVPPGPSPECSAGHSSEDAGDICAADICEISSDLNAYVTRLDALTESSNQWSSNKADVATDADELIVMEHLIERTCLTDYRAKHEGGESVRPTQVVPSVNHIKIDDVVCIGLPPCGPTHDSRLPDDVMTASEDSQLDKYEVLLNSTAKCFVHRRSIPALRLGLSTSQLPIFQITLVQSLIITIVDSLSGRSPKSNAAPSERFQTVLIYP